MGPYLNAILLRFDGVDGKEIPTKQQVAVAWAATAFIASRLLK